MQLERVCHRTLPWLISFSLDHMRRFGSLAVAALLASCASREAPSPNWHVIYYDRNGDGIVDYELHILGSGHADADWALIDTRFRGRYNMRVRWGITLEKQRVDISVPKHVKITPGKPPKSYTY
jgi:hypothetical protein